MKDGTNMPYINAIGNLKKLHTIHI